MLGLVESELCGYQPGDTLVLRPRPDTSTLLSFRPKITRIPRFRPDISLFYISHQHFLPKNDPSQGRYEGKVMETYRKTEARLSFREIEAINFHFDL